MKNKKGGINMEQKQMVLLFVVGILVGAVAIYGAAITGYVTVRVPAEQAQAAGLGYEKTMDLRVRQVMEDIVIEQKAMGNEVLFVALQESVLTPSDAGPKLSETFMHHSAVALAKTPAGNYELDRIVTADFLTRISPIVGPSNSATTFGQAFKNFALIGNIDNILQKLENDEIVLSEPDKKECLAIGDIGGLGLALTEISSGLKEGTLSSGTVNLVYATSISKTSGPDGQFVMHFAETPVLAIGARDEFQMIGRTFYNEAKTRDVSDIVRQAFNSEVLALRLIEKYDFLVAHALATSSFEASAIAADSLYQSLQTAALVIYAEQGIAPYASPTSGTTTQN